MYTFTSTTIAWMATVAVIQHYVNSAIIPIEESHDAMLHPSKQLLRGSPSNNVTASPRYLGLGFDDILIDPLSESELLQKQPHHRELFGSRSAIVFRLNGPMGSPSASIDALWGAIFTSGNSVKHQMARCSMGEFQLNPTNWGVMDLYIDAYTGTPHSDLAQMAEAAALQAVGNGYTDIRQAADHILFVMPNRGDGYVGSAEVCQNGQAGTSFFGDTYALSLSVVMHELSHNLNLRHASMNGDSYGDVTSMMGISSGQTDGNPLQCFNACNHWTLGWYSSKRLDLSSGLSSPITTQVVAFVDADQSWSGQYALVKLPGNLYMQFNRAKEHNSGTRDKIDQLVIVWDTSGNNQGETSMVVGLDMYNPTYNSGSITVQVCSVQIGGAVDYMVVSIGPGWTDCNAGQTNAQSTSVTQQSSDQGVTNTQSSSTDTNNRPINSWNSWNIP